MAGNSIDIEQIKNEIKKLKLEILEKEDIIDELLEMITGNVETDEDSAENSESDETEETE